MANPSCVGYVKLECKRGRPAGKDKVRLTEDETRARSAGCERQRRLVIQQLKSDLAALAGLRDGLTTPHLLSEVIKFIKMTDQSCPVYVIPECKRGRPAGKDRVP